MEGFAGEQASDVVCDPERYSVIADIGDACYVRDSDDVPPLSSSDPESRGSWSNTSSPAPLSRPLASASVSSS